LREDEKPNCNEMQRCLHHFASSSQLLTSKYIRRFRLWLVEAYGSESRFSQIIFQFHKPIILLQSV